MATKKRRSKFSLKKVKKMFINLFNKVKNYFVNVYNKFMSLPKYVRHLVYLWSIVLLIIITLIIGTFSNNKMLEKYHEAENNVNNAALRYVQNYNIYPTRDSKLNISLEVLKDLNLISQKDVGNDNTCKGYSILYYDDENESYVSKSYINCNKYTSDEYFDYNEVKS